MPIDFMSPVNKAFREFRRYTSDGLPSAPVSAPLPVGDPSSGIYNPAKSEIRDAFEDVQTAINAGLDDLVGSFETYRYIATSSQTVFTGADANSNTLSYVEGKVIVTVNGVTLSPNTYTASNGTSITLSTPRSASDVVVIYSFGSFAVADVWTRAEADGRYTSKDRFVFPEDYGALGNGVADDAPAFNAAHAAGFTNIMLRAGANYGIGTTINVPANANYFSAGRSLFNKIANCDMFTLASGGNQRFFNFRVEGNGATRTGRGFVVTGGNDQLWDNVSCFSMESYCLEVTAVDSMQRSLISGGLWSRTTSTLYAIKYFGSAPYTTFGTNADSRTTGARRIQNVSGGGTHVLDLAGTTEVTVSGISTTGIQITAGTGFCKFYGNRISGDVIVAGTGHSFSDNTFGGGLTLTPGTIDCTVQLGQMAGIFNDLSGNQTNLIYGEATDFIPIFTATVTNPTLGAGSASGRFMRSGRTVSLNISIVFGAGMTGGSGNYEIKLPAPYDTLKFKGEVVGTAWAFDAGTGFRVGACQASAGLIKFNMSSDGAGGNWTNTAPITWASGDRFTISATGMLGE